MTVVVFFCCGLWFKVEDGDLGSLMMGVLGVSRIKHIRVSSWKMGLVNRNAVPSMYFKHGQSP